MTSFLAARVVIASDLARRPSPRTSSSHTASSHKAVSSHAGRLELLAYWPVLTVKTTVFDITLSLSEFAA